MTKLALAVGIVMLLVGCRTEDDKAPPTAFDADARYQALIAAHERASFRMVFGYDDDTGAHRQVLVWTKSGDTQRLDVITERAALSGLSVFSTASGKTSCTWATDESRVMADAFCGPGSIGLGELMESISGALPVGFVRRVSVLDSEGECFKTIMPIGRESSMTICLSPDGIPLQIESQSETFPLRAVAVKREPVPGNQSWLDLVIPSAIAREDTVVKNVPADSLSLPDVSLLADSLTATITP